MRVKIYLAVCLAVVSASPMERVLAQGTAPSAAAENPGLAALKGDDRRVVAYLVDDWGKDAANTSVDIAMNALKVRPSDETRFRIGNHIKNHPELHAILRQWGWETVVLTPDEKLVARTIVSAERDKKAPPSRAEISQIVHVSEKDVDRAAAMLARYEILKEDRSVGGIGYVATKPRYVNWQQWLDFQFHRVSLGSGRAFSVDWTSDFLSLVSGKFSSERITIDDSSPDGATRIRVIFDKGQFVRSDPPSTIVFNGGGWQLNNLFSSEEALNRWLERYPELKGRPFGSVAQTLERVRAR